MSSLYGMHEMNAYRADNVCLSFSPHGSTREPLGGFRLNLVWTLCHCDLP
jgi:hypothetical protein